MQINKSGGSKKSVTLFCFTPGIMVFTFTLEILLALFTFVKNRTTVFGRVATFILIFLAFFQLAEYQICRGSDPLLWSRIGLFSITLLPILGLYLISLINKKTWLLYLGAVLSIGFAFYFVFVPKAIEGAVCGGNYVIFNASQNLFKFYGFYYFGFLLLAMWESFQRLKENPRSKTLRKVLFWSIVGYLSFILPLTLVYIFVAGSRSGIASIMCGFAIIFALILALKIVPLYHKLDPRAVSKKEN
jgi:hypothetical protein